MTPPGARDLFVEVERGAAAPPRLGRRRPAHPLRARERLSGRSLASDRGRADAAGPRRRPSTCRATATASRRRTIAGTTWRSTSRGRCGRSTSGRRCSSGTPSAARRRRCARRATRSSCGRWCWSTRSILPEPFYHHPEASASSDLYGAKKRRRSWPSREAMRESLASKSAYARWRPEMLDLFVQEGVRETERPRRGDAEVRAGDGGGGLPPDAVLQPLAGDSARGRAGDCAARAVEGGAGVGDGAGAGGLAAAGGGPSAAGGEPSRADGVSGGGRPRGARPACTAPRRRFLVLLSLVDWCYSHHAARDSLRARMRAEEVTQSNAISAGSHLGDVALAASMLDKCLTTPLRVPAGLRLNITTSPKVTRWP